MHKFKYSPGRMLLLFRLAQYIKLRSGFAKFLKLLPTEIYAILKVPTYKLVVDLFLYNLELNLGVCMVHAVPFQN
jgi:hypothetical protein